MKQRLTAVALVLALLGAGVVIGVVVERAWLAEAAAPGARNGDRARFEKRFERRFEKFKARLNLRGDQADAVKAIMREARVESRTIHKRVRPELMTIRQAAQAKIRALLDSEQQLEYEKVIEERKRRRRERRGRRGPMMR